MKAKKDMKSKNIKTGNGAGDGERFGEVATKADLKTFLLNVRDKMAEGAAAGIYGLSAINFVLNLPAIGMLLDNDNKELARDIWLRIKQSGLQVRNPPMLFGEDEEVLAGADA